MSTSHIIECGDCLNLMKGMPDKSVDMVLTSPPYDNLRMYKGYSFDFENVARELFRVTAIGGVVVWVVGDATNNGSETGTSFRQALFFKQIGFNLHDTQIYAKNSYMPLTHNRYEQSFEYMFVLSKGRPASFNPIMVPCLTAGTKRNRSSSKANGDLSYAERQRDERTEVNTEKQHPNVFFYDVGKNEKTKHPAPFPLELALDQITSWSNPDDVCLDPFAGSGTTGVACVQIGRSSIQFELSPEYCEIAERRLDEAIAKKQQAATA
jgi:DNA modification methylase